MVMDMRWLLVACVLTSLTTTGYARHTEESRITDGTANTLRHGEVRVGLFTAEAGLGGAVEFGVSPPLWLAKVSNLFVKARVNADRTNMLAVSLGGYGINLRDLSDKNQDALLYVVNGGVHFTRRLEEFSLSLGVIFARVGITEVEAGSSIDLRGVISGSTGLLRPTLQWRLSTTTAFVVEMQLRLFQTIQADAQSQERINSRVTIKTYADGKVEMDDGMPANVSGFFVWSYDHFNLKFGLQYGYFSIPLAGFFIEGAKIAIPVVDLFWRF
jgi:hypothetical protein